MVNRRTPVATRNTKSHKGLSDNRILARIGKTIRAVRVLRGLTQTSLAKSLGISQNHLSNIEKGLREPSIILIARLSKALQIGIDLLILPALEPKRFANQQDQSLGSELQEFLFEVLQHTAESK